MITKSTLFTLSMMSYQTTNFSKTYEPLRPKSNDKSPLFQTVNFLNNFYCSMYICSNQRIEIVLQDTQLNIPCNSKDSIKQNLCGHLEYEQGFCFMKRSFSVRLELIHVINMT